MEKLAKSTGAKIVNRIKTITEDDLGSADSIVEHKIGKDYMIFIENAKDLKAITIMIRGGSEQIIDDTERTLKNGLFVLKGLLEQPKIVGGGGSIEIELKKRLMDFAQKMSGKEQIPIESFADALEIIPKVLIQNSGRDPLDVLTEIRATLDYANEKYLGFDSYSNEIVDVISKGIIDPVKIKSQIYSMAGELAILLTRIDEVIKTSSKKGASKK